MSVLSRFQMTAFALLATQTAIAEPTGPSVYGMYGTPSLVEMPTADMAEDADIALTVSHFGMITRSTLTFQIMPRLSGSFRYSLHRRSVGGPVQNYDRSFDLSYLLMEETARRPAVAVGLRDFMGTGVYSGEYFVATKNLTPRIRASAGLGWGVLGDANPIGSIGTRDYSWFGSTGQGGTPNIDRWFKGDFSAFGGVAWQATPKLTLVAEYSSSAFTPYSIHILKGLAFPRKSQVNFGLRYKFTDSTTFSAYSMYGNEVGAQLTYVFNPKRPVVLGGNESAPLPIARRAQYSATKLGWGKGVAEVPSIPTTSLEKLLAAEGLELIAIKVDGAQATLHFHNARYGAVPQALGRAARVMTQVMPASVETFVLVPMSKGMALTQVTLRRSDLETFEHAPSARILERAEFAAATGPAGAPLGTNVPKFTWSLSPYIDFSVFDPDNPLRYDLGLRLKATYELSSGLILSGSVTKKAFGNLDSVTRPIPSGLPRVRTDYAKYSKQGDPALEHLTFASYSKLAPSIYARVTAGYLERMYGGVSGEVLWKPIDSRLALGAEVNYVKQRDFDQGFGFRPYEVMTGHVSAYYQFTNQFMGKIDVGRYLAGDYGATVTLEREFNNGWRVGGYATVTDVPSNVFGEGSFDKGIYFTIPVNWVIGTPSRQSNTLNVQSLTRDGGAKVFVSGRLYDQLRDYGGPSMRNNWGRFWR